MSKLPNLSDPTEKFTDWERFQSLASELISPKVEINKRLEADFTASIPSAYRLATSMITLLDINNDLPGLHQLLEYKQRLREM
jgi:hypothetical protein